MPVIFYDLLREGTTYADPVADFRDRLQPQRLICYHVKRLRALGREVALDTCSAARPEFSEQQACIKVQATDGERAN